MVNHWRRKRLTVRSLKFSGRRRIKRPVWEFFYLVRRSWDTAIVRAIATKIYWFDINDTIAKHEISARYVITETPPIQRYTQIPARQAVRQGRPQPNGLKMRFKPSG